MPNTLKGSHLLLDIQDEYRVTDRDIVVAKCTIYPEFVAIFKPNARQLALYNPNRSEYPTLNNHSQEEYETSEEGSLRRTRKAIKDIVLTNDFNMFATFTFAEDRSDVEKSKQKMADWLKNQKSRHGNFQSLLVAEFHKKHNAIHFHGLLNGFKGRVKDAVHPYTGKQIQKRGKPVYQFAGYKSGFSNFQYIDDKAESKTIVSFYIQKYLKKDMPLIFGKNRYWVSKGLNRPTQIDLTSSWFESITPRHIQETDYGQILYFDRSDVEVFLP